MPQNYLIFLSVKDENELKELDSTNDKAYQIAMSETNKIIEEVILNLNPTEVEMFNEIIATGDENKIDHMIKGFIQIYNDQKHK